MLWFINSGPGITGFATGNLHMIIHGFAFGNLQNRHMSIICKLPQRSNLVPVHLPGSISERLWSRDKKSKDKLSLDDKILQRKPNTDNKVNKLVSVFAGLRAVNKITLNSFTHIPASGRLHAFSTRINF